MQAKSHFGDRSVTRSCVCLTPDLASRSLARVEGDDRAGQQAETDVVEAGLAEDVDSMEFQNGQGLIGAVMLNLRPTFFADIASAPDLTSPPGLTRFAVRAAIWSVGTGWGEKTTISASGSKTGSGVRRRTRAGLSGSSRTAPAAYAPTSPGRVGKRLPW